MSNLLAGVSSPARSDIRGGLAPARWSDVALYSFLMLSAALPYVNTLLNGFVYDDHNQVIYNPYIQSLRHLKEIFSTNVWSFVGAYGVTNYYRPLMTLGYLLCYQLFGPLPYGFHLANLFVHTAVVCVLFQLTERMFGDRALALAAAVVFALHPIHTESVAWVAAVTDLEVTFFYVLTFWFFLGVARSSGWRFLAVQAGMAASFVLTILSKEQALTLPLLATIYEHFYRDDCARTTGAKKISRYGALWLLALAYFLFRVRFFGALAPVLQRPQLTWYQAFLSAFALTGEYMWKLVWPIHLNAFYVFHKSDSWLDSSLLAGLASLMVVAAVFLSLRKRRDPVSFGLVWLFATLAPVLNARWMASNVFAEHYLYLPSVGFCWLAGWTFERLRTKASSLGAYSRLPLACAAGVLAALCVLRIVTRNRDWRDDEALYVKTLAASPDAYSIRNNLGTVYWSRGDVNAAEREWARALKLAPQSVVILNNLGLVYNRRKQHSVAVKYFERALAAKPDFTDTRINLGTAYQEMGLKDRAEKEFQAAVMLSPLNFRARNKLGSLYMDAGRLREAEEQFRASVESAPTVEALDALGDLYLRRGLRDLAERAYRQAEELEPYDSHARFKLGALYAARGRNAEAVGEYETGLKSDPTNAEALAALKNLKH